MLAGSYQVIPTYHRYSFAVSSWLFHQQSQQIRSSIVLLLQSHQHGHLRIAIAHVTSIALANHVWRHRRTLIVRHQRYLAMAGAGLPAAEVA